MSLSLSDRVVHDNEAKTITSLKAFKSIKERTLQSDEL